MAALQGSAWVAGPLIRIAEDDPLGAPRASKGARRLPPPEGALAPAIRVRQPLPARPALPEVSGHARRARPGHCYSSAQSLSRVQLFATSRTAAHQASLSITNSRSLLKSRSIESVMPSSHLILCRPLLLLPSVFPRSLLWMVIIWPRELRCQTRVARLFHTLRGVGWRTWPLRSARGASLTRRMQFLFQKRERGKHRGGRLSSL